MSTQSHSAVADQPAQTTDTQKAPVFTPEHPEFPKLLYNSKTRTTAPAKDKDDENKLKGKGYTEDPYPVIPPDQMTPQDMQQLESLLHKLLAEIAKYAPQPGAGSTAPSADSQPVPGAEPYAGATGAKSPQQGTGGAASNQAAAQQAATPATTTSKK